MQSSPGDFEPNPHLFFSPGLGRQFESLQDFGGVGESASQMSMEPERQHFWETMEVPIPGNVPQPQRVASPQEGNRFPRVVRVAAMGLRDEDYLGEPGLAPSGQQSVPSVGDDSEPTAIPSAQDLEEEAEGGLNERLGTSFWAREELSAAPPSDSVCSICFELPKEPVLCSQCEHAFCKQCLERCSDQRERCPTCQCSLRDCPYRTAGRLYHNLLGHLKVACPFARRGCEVQTDVSVREYQAHARTCPRRPLVCGSKNFKDAAASQGLATGGSGCRKLVECSELQSHLQTCQAQSQLCSACSLTLPRRDMPAHRAECPAILVACPQGCGLHIPRGKVWSHAEDCQSTLVECPVCNDIVARGMFSQHAAKKDSAFARSVREGAQTAPAAPGSPPSSGPTTPKAVRHFATNPNRLLVVGVGRLGEDEVRMGAEQFGEVDEVKLVMRKGKPAAVVGFKCPEAANQAKEGLAAKLNPGTECEMSISLCGGPEEEGEKQGGEKGKERDSTPKADPQPAPAADPTPPSPSARESHSEGAEEEAKEKKDGGDQPRRSEGEGKPTAEESPRQGAQPPPAGPVAHSGSKSRTPVGSHLAYYIKRCTELERRLNVMDAMFMTYQKEHPPKPPGRPPSASSPNHIGWRQVVTLGMRDQDYNSREFELDGTVCYLQIYGATSDGTFGCFLFPTLPPKTQWTVEFSMNGRVKEATYSEEDDEGQGYGFWDGFTAESTRNLGSGEVVIDFELIKSQRKLILESLN